MSPDVSAQNEFIRGHCGSVTIEAPSDRVIGAQRLKVSRRSIFRKPIGFPFINPVGQVVPLGLRLLCFHYSQ